jgi:hypothetical protein
LGLPGFSTLTPAAPPFSTTTARASSGAGGGTAPRGWLTTLTATGWGLYCRVTALTMVSTACCSAASASAGA